MRKPRGTIVAAVLLWMAVVAGCDRRDRESNSFPQRPIKVIVPFAAGGGSDSFGRILQLAIERENLLPQPLVIINVPGAGGTIGSRRVKNARPDGYTILLLHDGIITAKFSGQSSYGPEAFEAIAGSGDAAQVVTVAEDSPYRDLSELMNDAERRPGEIVFAANIGAPSHFAGLMLEQQKPGARFRYTQTGGGAKRFAALKGNHVDVSAFSIAEYIQFRDSGIRALALLGEQRHPDLPSVATAREQGFDVISQNMQFWWAPKGTAAEPINVIASAVERAMNSEPVRTKLAQMRMDPRFLRGAELEAEIRERTDRIAVVASRPIDSLPNFPMITAAIVLVLSLLVWYRSRGDRRMTGEQDPISFRGLLSSLSVILITVVYVLGLQFTAIGFRVLTVCFVFAVGISIARYSAAMAGSRVSLTRLLSLLGCVALLLSVGVHYLFTQVLVVDLP